MKTKAFAGRNKSKISSWLWPMGAMAMWFETKGENIPIFLKDKNMNQHFKKKEHESNIHWNLVVLITTCRKNM
jgi:hypothetical protein